MNGLNPPGQLRPLFGLAQAQSCLFHSASNQLISSTNGSPSPVPVLDGLAFALRLGSYAKEKLPERITSSGSPFFRGTHHAFAAVVGICLFAIGVSVAQVTTNPLRH
jgi:hypothetical protein